MRTLPTVLAICFACLPLLASSVPKAQRELDYVLKARPDLKSGAALYETCAACHGSSGEGVADGTVPVIGGQHFVVIAKQLVDFRSNVRGDLRMQHFSDTRHLSLAQEIADVSSYISSLKPTPQHEEPAAAAAVIRGARIYARFCERCHEPVGEGNEDTLVPRIVGQHPQYLMRQLDFAKQGTRPAMSHAHAMRRELSDADVEAVAIYVSTMGLPGHD